MSKLNKIITLTFLTLTTYLPVHSTEIVTNLHIGKSQNLDSNLFRRFEAIYSSEIEKKINNESIDYDSKLDLHDPYLMQEYQNKNERIARQALGPTLKELIKNTPLDEYRKKIERIVQPKIEYSKSKNGEQKITFLKKEEETKKIEDMIEDESEYKVSLRLKPQDIISPHKISAEIKFVNPIQDINIVLDEKTAIAKISYKFP